MNGLEWYDWCLIAAAVMFAIWFALVYEDRKHE